jgi:hypothetical protein
MPDTINVRDLPDEDIRFIKELVEFLREKAKLRQTREEEKTSFSSWNLGVKGKLTREEIYGDR